MEKRFFVEKDKISNSVITLDGDEHMHLSKVLRLRVGDNVECFYDNSDILKCKIKEISKNCSILEVVESEACQQNPNLNISLFMALPKLDKLELITQKVTELGIGEVVPFSSKFCVAKENSNKIERLKKIVVSACKQCGRTKLVEINNTIKFDKMLEIVENYDLVVFANECEQSKTLKEVLTKQKQVLAQKLQNNSLKVAYIVGSEGGFDKDEIEKISKIAHSITLGKRILRAETAGIVLGGILCYELGLI